MVWGEPRAGWPPVEERGLSRRVKRPRGGWAEDGRWRLGEDYRSRAWGRFIDLGPAGKEASILRVGSGQCA